MKTSQEGIEFIKKEEGFRNKPYVCSAGIWTIGYGSTFYESGSKVKQSDGSVSEERAEDLLKHILETFEHALNKMLRVKLKKTQFDALMSFIYNIGIGAFKNSTLLKRVNANPEDPDIYYQFQRWCRATNPKTKKLDPVEGLRNRRLREARLYFS